MTTKKNRTTYKQLEAMVNYLEQNKEVLSHRGLTKNFDKWTELCNILNSLRRGPVKSANQWKRVLIEWKYNTKKKFKANDKILNDAEEKLIRVLSENPYENINASEIKFAQVPNDEDKSFHSPIQLVKMETVDYDVKEELQFFEENVNIHEFMPKSEITEISDESNPGFLPSTSNSDTIKQKEVMEQTEEGFTILIENNDSLKNLGLNNHKRPQKSRKFRRASNVSREELRRNKQETMKMYKFLSEAMFKLAESNCKIAESNYKIAQSNEKLAEALNIYVKTKQK